MMPKRKKKSVKRQHISKSLKHFGNDPPVNLNEIIDLISIDGEPDDLKFAEQLLNGLPKKDVFRQDINECIKKKSFTRLNRYLRSINEMPYMKKEQANYIKHDDAIFKGDGAAINTLWTTLSHTIIKNLKRYQLKKCPGCHQFFFDKTRSHSKQRCTQCAKDWKLKLRAKRVAASKGKEK